MVCHPGGFLFKMQLKTMAAMGYILIADDDEDFLAVTGKLLRSRGYKCDCVPDAHAGADKLGENEYDLLISDIEMPGNQNLSLIRSVPQLIAGLPIILVTGHPTIRTATESFQLSVVAYLVKPVDPEALISAAEQAIERFRSCRAIRQNRRRLQDFCSELERLESLMQSEPRGSASTLRNIFPGLIFQQIVNSLQDLELYTEAIAQKKNENSASGSESAGPVELLCAVRETIAVLEKTKSAFKSKDLGNLRRNLEALVEKGSESSKKSC